MQGRPHAYEGHEPLKLSYPMRLAAGLGVSTVITTNAAGGIAETLPPGSVMAVIDHVALPPPRGALLGRGRAKPLYDPALVDLAEASARRLDITMRRGVYAWTTGPNYETPAEVRALRRLGADAVGMSLVPEALAANRLNLRVLGLSLITNRAAGLADPYLNHEDVLKVGRRMQSKMTLLLENVVSKLLQQGR